MEAQPAEGRQFVLWPQMPPTRWVLPFLQLNDLEQAMATC